MEGLTAAHVPHVPGIVLAIDGVALVTAVLLPAAKRIKTPGAARADFFEKIERGFALRARITTLVTRASGSHGSLPFSR